MLQAPQVLLEPQAQQEQQVPLVFRVMLVQQAPLAYRETLEPLDQPELSEPQVPLVLQEQQVLLEPLDQ